MVRLTCIDAVAGVGLVRRKKVVVLQCRHVLRMNQHNYTGDQHQHHRHHRSIDHHFDRGNMRLSAAKNPSRDTQGTPFDHIFTNRESRRFRNESSKLSSARSGKFECRNRVPDVDPRILFKSE